MSERGCIIPIVVRFRGVPNNERLVALSDAISRTVSSRLRFADHTIAVREGWPAWRKTHAAPEIRFSGTTIDDDLRRRVTSAIETGIARALAGGPAAASQALPFVLAQYHPPAKKAAAVRKPAAKKPVDVPWRVLVKVGFHITPRRFFEIRARFPKRPDRPDEIDPLELYYPLLDIRRPAVAWVVEVLREYEFTALNDEVIRSFAATRQAVESVWSVHGWSTLRSHVVQAEQDGAVARQIPEFGRTGFSGVRPGPGEGEQQIILRPGAWVLSVFLPLPRMRLEDTVEIGQLQWTDLALHDAVGLVTPEDFAAELGLQWAEVEQRAPNSTVTVSVEPFTVRRKVHERTLAALFEQRRREQFAIKRLGRIVRLADDAIVPLPPRLQVFLKALAGDGTSPRHEGIDGGFWLPDSQGASLAPFFEQDLGDQVLLGRNASFLAAQADEVQRILGLENTFWNANRNQALGAFIDRWRDRDPRLFGLLLDELQRRGTLDAFLEAVRGLSSLDAYRRRTVIALAVPTRYAQHAGVLALVRQQEELVGSLEAFRYNVDAQEVWIDGDEAKRLRAAGDSLDDKAGVVAEVKPYYSEAVRIHQPRPEVLDRLREPTRKKVGEFMARTICAPGERMTREQLLQKAIQEAAKELSPPLEEKDFVRVTMRLSIRVLKLERRVKGGFAATYVHFQEVRKIGDQPWEPSGEIQIASAIAFEARLRYYHVEHLMSALTVFFLAQTVLYGGLLVIELGLATLGQLIVFVAIQVVIYRFTTDAEDRTLEGYLLAALRGELDAVGFKLISGLVKGAGQLVAGQLITRELVSGVATKWIVFALRGTVTAVGVGALEVTSQFAEDLLRYSHCQGWSSPAKYWDRFKTGFLMTLAFEFVAIPILAPPLRLALEKAGSVVEAAKALRGSGKSLPEITTPLLQGAEELEVALRRAIYHAAGKSIAQEYWRRVADVVKALGREYESRAYRSLLDLYGPELSTEAARGLRRLLATASEGEIDRALQRLLGLRASGLKMTTPSDLFRVLGGVDDEVLSLLVKSGQLTEVATSPRLLALLTQEPAAASKLLTGPFKSSVGALERYLGRLEGLAPDARQSVLRALGHDHPLPPDLLLAAARQVDALDEPTLALLRRLLATASERGIDRLLQRLVQQRASVSDLFRALGGVDDEVLSLLVKSGQLTEVATSPRLLALLTQEPAAASKLLTGPFKSSVGALERYLGRLEGLAPDARQSVLRALGHDHPLPPDLLLAAARQVGALDEPTLALLRQLQDARIQVEALFDRSGPSLKQFADEFAKLSESERAVSLQRAAGGPPAQVLLPTLTANARTVITDVTVAEARDLIAALGSQRVNLALSLGAAGPVRGSHLRALQRRLHPRTVQDMLDSAGNSAGRLRRVAAIGANLDAAAARVPGTPVGAGTLALDTNVTAAIDELLLRSTPAGTPIRFNDLDLNRRDAINTIRDALGLGPYVDPPAGGRPRLEDIIGPNADLRAPQLFEAEILAQGPNARAGVLPQLGGITPVRTHPDYERVISEMTTDPQIGGPKGAVDRTGIADVMFAQAGRGVTPRFVTTDEDIPVRLAQRFVVAPRSFAPVSGTDFYAQLRLRYPEGRFTIEILGHRLEVVFQPPTGQTPVPP